MTVQELKETVEYRKYGFAIVKCPICGRDTLNMHWICDNCDWEYDGTPDGEYSDCNSAYPENHRKAYLEKQNAKF